MANRPIYPGEIKNAALIIEPADTTTAQDLVTAGTNGARINFISAVTDDTSDVDLIINYNDGATDHPIALVTVPAGSGTDGTNAAVSVLNAADMPFLGEDLSYYLEAGDKITVAASATVTADKTVYLVASYGDY
jgi:hypothetical protein